jgi:hypothetical protein
MNSTLTQEELRARLHYDPVTGLFTRRIATGRFRVGEVAGSKTSHDGKTYIRICVLGVDYYAHRLAWFYMTGEWPAEEVDHRNGVGTDNWFENLRHADRAINAQNLQRAHHDNPVGVLGVSWVKAKGCYRASLTVNKKSRYLGYFDTVEEAQACYLEAKRRIHEGCTI